MEMTIHRAQSPRPRARISAVQSYELDELGIHILLENGDRIFYPWGQGTEQITRAYSTKPKSLR